MLQDVVIAIMAGAAYGLSHYLKRYGTEDFDPAKLLATITIAIACAVGLQLSGLPVNEMTIEQRFLTYAGLVPIVENILKTVLRRARGRKGGVSSGAA